MVSKSLAFLSYLLGTRSVAGHTRRTGLTIARLVRILMNSPETQSRGPVFLGSSLNNSSGRLAGVAGAEQALGFWYDLVAEAGSTGANGVRTRHAARYGDFAEFASGRRQAG